MKRLYDGLWRCKVMKNLVTNPISGLRNALDITAQTHLLASLLNEASFAKDAAMLVPFQERFKVASDQLTKLSDTVRDREIRAAVADLLAFGRGDDSVAPLRGKQLAATLRADQTIEENAKIQRDLDQAVSGLVGEVERGMNRRNDQLTETLGSERMWLLIVAALSLIVAEIAAAGVEQSKGLAQVNRALAQMDQATQQNSALVGENVATANMLDQQARAMDECVSLFRFSDEPERGADRARPFVVPMSA